jgi:hypothetical protein
MDRLDKAKQAEIRKLSDTRLVGKLVKAGLQEEELELLDRTALLNRWAEIVAAGGEAGPRKVEGPVSHPAADHQPFLYCEFGSFRPPTPSTERMPAVSLWPSSQ